MPKRFDVITCRRCGLVLAQWTADVVHGEKGYASKLRAVEIDALPEVGTTMDKVRCPKCDTPWGPDPSWLAPLDGEVGPEHH